MKQGFFLSILIAVWLLPYWAMAQRDRRNVPAGNRVPRATGTPVRDRPNVILILTDDQGYGDLSCHGNPVLNTPNIDRLYSRSIRLTDYHSAPMCTPTRGQLMTGLDAARNGAVNVSSGRSLLNSRYATMADLFTKNGYQTGLFGKWHLGDNYPYQPQNRGFGESLWFPSSHLGALPDHWGNDYFDDTYIRNGNRRAYPGYCTDVFFRESMTWMEAAASQGKPFFTYLPLNAPHAPLFAPTEDVKAMEAVFATNATVASLKPEIRKNLMQYLAMIRNIDTNVGCLLTFLEKAKLLDNTIVLFTTDNGSTQGQHYFNAGMRGRKGELWEGGHRVPLFISWPKGGIGTAPGDVTGLAQAQDVLPTLVELCQLKNAPRFDGISLAPALQRKNTIPDERMLVINYSRVPVAFDAPSPASPSIMKREGGAVLWKRWRLLEDRQLFNLDSDPMQQTNVIDQNPEVATKMRAYQNRWWDGVRESANAVQRIPIGTTQVNPTLLTACEWLDVVVDQQKQAISGVQKNSFWNLTVSNPGTYEFELRRWPKEVDGALDATNTASQTLSIRKARIQIGATDQSVSVAPGSKQVNFTAQLAAGPVQLQTWFYDSSDKPLCGAYYVYVNRK